MDTSLVDRSKRMNESDGFSTLFVFVYLHPVAVSLSSLSCLKSLSI